MESRPPAAWLGRKDAMSVTLEFCKCFYTSSRSEKGICYSERICISYRQRGWVRGKRGQFWDRDSSVCKEEVSPPVHWPWAAGGAVGV